MSFISPIVDRQSRRFTMETGRMMTPVPQYFITELSRHPQEWKVAFLVDAICYRWKSKQCPDMFCDFPYPIYLSFAESKQSTIRKNLGIETNLLDYQESHKRIFKKTLASKYELLSDTCMKLYELAREAEKTLVDGIFSAISDNLELPFAPEGEE